ncbi:MAG: DUF4167 domain-containing protein, partial [Pseudomonadota bacterium]
MPDLRQQAVGPAFSAVSAEAQPASGGDVIDVGAADAESPLVETPENRAPRQRKPRKKPDPQPVAEDQATP